MAAVYQSTTLTELQVTCMLQYSVHLATGMLHLSTCTCTFCTSTTLMMEWHFFTTLSDISQKALHGHLSFYKTQNDIQDFAYLCNTLEWQESETPHYLVNNVSPYIRTILCTRVRLYNNQCT